MASKSGFEAVILSLIESSMDKEKSVQEAMITSLVSSGKRHPLVLLTAVHAYLARHSKLPGNHRGILLGVMNAVCAESLPILPSDTVALIVNLAVQEMAMSKEVNEAWQAPASQLLVTLCKVQCNDVMDALLQKFQPGFPPQFYVIQTLGEMAVNNSFGFLPFLSDILSRTVPMLHGLKQDSLKLAFAIALRKYCRSIREYTSNINQAPDPSVKKEVYSSQIAAAYDILHGSWLKSKDVKLRSATIECLGEMCHIVSSEKLHEEIRKLLPVLLSAYNKQSSETLSVTEGICSLLEAAILDDSAPLQHYLDDIWAATFPQVSGVTDYGSSSLTSSKNQSEVLRCFHITAIKYADRLVTFLLQKLSNSHEKIKISALFVIRHLVNSSGPYMEDKKSLIVAGLKPALNDPSNKVKQAVCQLIAALADHGYLTLENGQMMIDFLLKQLCLPADTNSKRPPEGDVSNLTLKAQCTTALHLLAGSVHDAEQLMWPYLFQFICLEPFTPALGEICRCLALLARRLNTEGRFQLLLPPGDALLPGPQQIFGRLFVCLSLPKVHGGHQIIELLGEIQSIFSPNCSQLWGLQLPQLRTSLDASPPETSGSPEPDVTNDQTWENQLLKFLSRTIDTVYTDELSSALAAALGQHFHLYNKYPREKKFLFKALGGVLKKINNRQFVLDHLDLMFRACNFSEPLERKGCAVGVGFCASTHIDLVLTKLENEAKLEFQRKSGGLLGFIIDSMPVKSENDIEMSNMKATIMLCYGYVTLYCPANVVTQKLETVILRFLVPYLETSKDVVVKESLMYTIDLIAKSVHQTHLGADYNFERRGNILNNIKEYVKSESNELLNTRVRILAMRAAASLAKLDPPLPEADIWALCSICAQQTYPLVSAKDDVTDSENQMSLEAAITSLDSLFEEILRKTPNCPTLTVMMKIVQPWFTSESATVRYRAVDSAHILLKAYYAYAEVTLGRATDFALFGSLMAKFCPRFCDSSLTVRQRALDCVHWLLAVGSLHLGHEKGEKDSVVQSILDLNELLEKPDISAHLSVIESISKVACQRLFGTHLQTYITVLFDLILDKQDGVSCAAATLLKYALGERGPQLVAEAEKLVSVLVTKLSEVRCVQTYAEMLQALYAFSNHHLLLVVNNLLAQSLPYSQQVCDCWHTLARDQMKLVQMFDRILELLGSENPYETDSANNRYARSLPISCLSALIELVKGGESEELINKFCSRILAKVLLQCGALVGTIYSRSIPQFSPELCRQKPLLMVQSAVKALLLRTRADQVVLALNDGTHWADFLDELNYVDAILETSRTITTFHPQWAVSSCVHLRPYQQSSLNGHRIVVVAFIAEFVRDCPDQADDPTLIDDCVNSLMLGLTDSCLKVRQLSVRGMGNLSNSPDKILAQYSPVILSSLMAGLEDPGDIAEEVAVEAMKGLAKVVHKVDKEQMNHILINVLLRIRTCFDKDSAAVRMVAFELFGHLAKFGSCESFEEQVQSNLVSLILHLNDDVIEVRKSCAYTLSCIAPFTKSHTVSTLFERLADSKPIIYRDFLNQCAKELVASFPDQANFYALSTLNYFKCSSTRIKCNAVLLIGYLLTYIPNELRGSVSKDPIIAGVCQLVKDGESDVRICAAEAAALLYAY